MDGAEAAPGVPDQCGAVILPPETWSEKLPVAPPRPPPQTLRMTSNGSFPGSDVVEQSMSRTSVPVMPFLPSPSTAAAVKVPRVRAGPGVVVVIGPNGGRESIRITAGSSPQAIEHCLRCVFSLAEDTRILLRDSTGCALPLDGGLLLLADLAEAGSVGTSPGGSPAKGDRDGSATFRLEIVESVQDQDWATQPQRPPASSPASQTRSHHEILQHAEEEYAFWIKLTGPLLESTSRATLDSSFGVLQRPGTVMFEDDMPESPASHSDKICRIASFDTSPHRIDFLYASWVGRNGKLTAERLRKCMSEDCDVFLSEQQLQDGLHRVRTYLRSRSRGHEDENENEGEVDGLVPRLVFTSLWQRLMLAAVCQPLQLCSQDCDIRLIGYNERECSETAMSEQSFMFGGNLRFKEETNKHISCWARIDSAGPDRLARMGVKFFLHPIATEEAIDAARNGMTKVDVFRHQYFACLEVYALKKDACKSSDRCLLTSADGGPPRLCDIIVQSTMFVVATGNPRRGYRDWLLSIVNTDEMTKADPLDHFASGPEAAMKVLDSVRQDLKAHGRLREYQADFLLYTIIDRAAGELLPICKAYGARLSWLQALLDEQKHKISLGHVKEVSRIRLELQELGQWVGQVRSIVNHLEVDCKGIEDGGAVSWTFGSWASGSGKSLLLFLRGTQESLDRSKDRLAVLDEYAINFTRDYERCGDVFMNKTLFVLTIATAVFLPAQFIAGVYGMNFELSDGTSAMPELKWGHTGYALFWVLVIAFLTAGACTAWRLLRR